MNRTVGALWDGTDKDGGKYLYGTISLGVFGEIRVVVFPNGYKEGTQPDHLVYVSQPKPKPSELPTEPPDVPF